MLIAKSTEADSFANPHDAPPLREVEGLRLGRKLQRPTFRYKRGLRQEFICICHDDVEVRLQLRMTGPSDERRKPE
jgi:hypothetical protein